MGGNIRSIQLERVIPIWEYEQILSRLEGRATRTNPAPWYQYCMIGETAVYESPGQLLEEIHRISRIDEISIRTRRGTESTPTQWKKVFARCVRTYHRNKQEFLDDLAVCMDDPDAYLELKTQQVDATYRGSKFALFQGEQQGKPVLFCGTIDLREIDHTLVDTEKIWALKKDYRAVIRPERFRP